MKMVTAVKYIYSNASSRFDFSTISVKLFEKCVPGNRKQLTVVLR